MNELEKAQAYMEYLNNILKEVSKSTGIPVPPLSAYRKHPKKLEIAAWIGVHMLAKEYDKKADS